MNTENCPLKTAPCPPTALITGGGGDLAQAIRLELESQGWQVHAPTRTQMDVTDKTQVQAVMGALPRLDLLIHNAGVLSDASMLKMTESDFQQVLQVHLKGAFLTTQAALKLMVKQRQGHIVTIGSFSALSGPVGQANYAAAKAGLIAFTQSLAAEYGPRNIRANCVLPGFLDTRMTRDLLAKHRPEVESRHTLGRLNTAEDAARFIAFLHTLENVSGQVFQLDSRIHRWG
ncbi:3-oxoacyl-[acyl-carrier protein] reductase [Prosthecobacter debontii]|uniref:3-oxoacyl-[acyl-carrier protein] reductase n=1 Tax=Prosthecobacter debontii TaxID=48467 RepID=A0A1T4X9K5_9BACT|nr:SDR family NAD(P)-dependent oxidoreductase [Prosthecobacter debontii]SKA86256.1 3-oxoacyl-[acyl-carrier protein] reductase [Prosthecobacter debontii]